MSGSGDYLKAILSNITVLRNRADLSDRALEERLILGPGWIRRFETAQTVPSIDMLLAIVRETGASPADLFRGLPDPEPATVSRAIFAEAVGQSLDVHFTYADYDATYRLPRATLEQFEAVMKTLRDGLSRQGAADASSQAKADAVARTFLEAVKLWPHASPSDLWWFIVYRAYCDPYNHPARFARLNFDQSWKRTGGWALEEVLVRHYGPFLRERGINLVIADAAAKRRFVETLEVGMRIEADKIDVVLTGDTPEGPQFFGVVHVKASFAERRTDDVPMSEALTRAGYTSPLWTMDCKGTPSATPVNRGELGDASGRRSAKRKDIEDEGYFTGCFSYNQNTRPSPDSLPEERRVHVCNFSDPDDAFSNFLIRRWRAFRVP